ncbi:MAG TPA: TraR/DksA family transcriptional regulator [Acidobacteria bacterium]|nr:TraR/DksA family transcriptional regulator [Acidobacteriota bacterium]
MRKREVERYRKRLLAKQEELNQRVRAVRSSETHGTGESAADLGDRALKTTSREMAYRLSTEEQTILKRIDRALQRIEEGTYGNCLNCGGAIQKGRLDAVPWARYCIDCQELLDRGEITALEP